MKKTFLSILLFSLSFAIYGIGDVVSTADQNVVLDVCDQNSEYSIENMHW